MRASPADDGEPRRCHGRSWCSSRTAAMSIRAPCRCRRILAQSDRTPRRDLMARTLDADVAIIGAGPVGLFAVFELGMLRLSSILIDALDEVGGQCAALYPEKPIYDIPAHPAIDAGELVAQLERQIAPFHAPRLLGRRVLGLAGEPGAF